jgi:CRP-like cAMP-binding protein
MSLPNVSGFVRLLSDPDRKALEGVGVLRRYKPGRLVLLEGDRINHVLILREGRVKVASTTRDGREIVLAVCGPGELIGELSVLGGQDEPCSATVEAIDPLAAQVISRDAFVDYLERHPHALLVLTRSIIARLRAADRRRLDFGSYDTPGRVARLLVEITEQHGRKTNDGIEMGVALSQDELAGLITASRESVARSLMSLRRRGLITTGRRSVIVRDLDGLRQLAV